MGKQGNSVAPEAIQRSRGVTPNGRRRSTPSWNAMVRGHFPIPKSPSCPAIPALPRCIGWVGAIMPEKSTVARAKEDLREGKSPTTAAGEFVREEIEHVREGKHGVRSAKQAIAIGLSKARRAGIPLPPPEKGTTSERTRKSAASAYAVGQKKQKPQAP